MKYEAQFKELTKRIERLLKDPTSIRAPFLRLARPVIRWLDWQPKPNIDAAQNLWRALKEQPEQSPTPPEELEKLLQKALAELGNSIKSAERSYVVNKTIPISFISWLQRLQLMLERTAALLEDPKNEDQRWIAAGTELVSILPPLMVRTEEKAEEKEAAEPGEATPGPSPSALLQLELSAVDHLIEMAQKETSSLSRRRHFLEAGRRLLLEASAALPLDADGVRLRQNFFAREIMRLNRLQAAGLSSDISFLHQARTAVSRGDRQRLYSSLMALDAAARAHGDLELASRTRQALQALKPLHPEKEDTRDSLLSSATESLGHQVIQTIREAYQIARQDPPQEEEVPAYILQARREFFKQEGEDQTLFAILATDGLFEVGGALSPLRVIEEQTYHTYVRTPTQKMSLVPAREVGDLTHAIVDDPRSVMMSLATGRLLTRRYIREETRPHSRIVMQSEVRVYVLDGSSSMLGPRARMRDAILISELVTLQKRLRTRQRSAKVALYYRYFTELLGPSTKVDSESTISMAITEVLSHMRTGNTDIQQALVDCFDQVRQERQRDQHLAKAQIVLITDGESTIDEDAILAARAGLDDLPIGVSVIALGQENNDLRELVAKQRARGEQAFYHYIDDQTLESCCNGNFDPETLLHLQQASEARTTQDESSLLHSMVGDLLDELADLERKRDLEALERLDTDEAARKELGLEAQLVLSEGERAHIEAMHQNRRALSLRFGRWFPVVDEKAQDKPLSSADTQDLDSVFVILSTVSEVVQVVGGSDLARRSDAIELLERLLIDARLTPRRYEEILSAYPRHLTPGLRALHQAVSPSQNQ